MKMIIKTAMAASLFTLASSSFAAPNNQASIAASVNPAEKTKIEAVVHEYLVKNPEVLVEAMQVLQRKQFEQAEQTVKQTKKIAATFANALFHQTGDPVIGNPNGKITLVEFFDYQCPHCVEMVPVVTAIVKANPDVRVVYKEFPIRGPLSETAARAALAANKQGKYQAFSHGLLQAARPLTDEIIFQVAKDAGLNIDQLKKDMNDKSIQEQVKNNIKLAQDLKLFGTPALFIGKTDSHGKEPINYMPGVMDQAQLQSMIDESKKS